MKLIDLIKENPELDVFAWVNYEVVGGDYCSWLGQFNEAQIREFAKVEPYTIEDYGLIFKDDYEDYLNYLCDTKGYTEKYAREVIESLYYEKAIFVDVGLPTKL